MRYSALWVGEDLFQESVDMLPSMVRVPPGESRVFSYGVIDVESTVRVSYVRPLPRIGRSLDLRVAPTWEWTGVLDWTNLQELVGAALPATHAERLLRRAREAWTTAQTSRDVRTYAEILRIYHNAPRTQSTAAKPFRAR